MSEMIYCQWVDATVEKEKLGEFCGEHVVDGKCVFCPTSDQIKLGMKPSELLRNISKG